MGVDVICTPVDVFFYYAIYLPADGFFPLEYSGDNVVDDVTNPFVNTDQNQFLRISFTNQPKINVNYTVRPPLCILARQNGTDPSSGH